MATEEGRGTTNREERTALEQETRRYTLPPLPLAEQIVLLATIREARTNSPTTSELFFQALYSFRLDETFEKPKGRHQGQERLNKVKRCRGAKKGQLVKLRQSPNVSPRVTRHPFREADRVNTTQNDSKRESEREEERKS